MKNEAVKDNGSIVYRDEPINKFHGEMKCKPEMANMWTKILRVWVLPLTRRNCQNSKSVAIFDFSALFSKSAL